MINIRDIRSANDMVKVVYFTDAHNQPTLNQDRFVWLSRLVNHEQPDYLIDGGDFDDFHSLCSHEKNETEKGRVKPALMHDLQCSAKARNILSENINCNPIKHVTLGNHEDRLWLYENMNREVSGLATGHYMDILDKNGWAATKYGAYLTLHGVDFTHCPFNGMGRPVGGDNVAKQAAEKSIADVIFGHTHQMTLVTAHKFGNNRSVTAYNLGCYMPDGYISRHTPRTHARSSGMGHTL